jgi:NAD(P)-dependent dehydrogenase (short-subunit alcohol dehydrogenase family)
LAIDLAGRVRVVGIEPAAIETKMLKSGFQGNLEAYNLLNKGHPIGRIGQAEEVANLAVALVNGGMDFINGISIRIDGGISSQLFEKIA